MMLAPVYVITMSALGYVVYRNYDELKSYYDGLVGIPKWKWIAGGITTTYLTHKIHSWMYAATTYMGPVFKQALNNQITNTLSNAFTPTNNSANSSVNNINVNIGSDEIEAAKKKAVETATGLAVAAATTKVVEKATPVITNLISKTDGVKTSPNNISNVVAPTVSKVTEATVNFVNGFNPELEGTWSLPVKKQVSAEALTTWGWSGLGYVGLAAAIVGGTVLAAANGLIDNITPLENSDEFLDSYEMEERRRYSF